MTCFSYSGWRRTAVVNTILMSIVTACIAASLAWSMSRAGSPRTNLAIYEGPCTSTERINLALHLILNIVSTGVLASSNFFMQVLNAPTREEVDKAHGKFQHLEIGIPSLRNLRYVSLFKTTMWSLFVISSIPIHLVFNSAIFVLDFQAGEFNLTIASESFVNGDSYHGPGASLIPPGAASGFGSHVTPLSSFLNDSSVAVRLLSWTSENSKSWDRIDVEACRGQYAACKARKQYGDVVLVTEARILPTASKPAANMTGFIINDIFNMTNSDIPWNPENYTKNDLLVHWSQFGPLDQPNSLWFSSPCSMLASYVSQTDCMHSCGSAIGGVDEKPVSESVWNISLSVYNATANPSTGHGLVVPGRPRFNTDEIGPQSFLNITHCYAQPINPSCKLGVSNILFLAVAICAGLKTILSLIVTTRLWEDVLITPGDAIASFITRPDPTTELRATLGIVDGRVSVRDWKAASPTPREWQRYVFRRLSSGIPQTAWLQVYVLACIVMVGTSVGLAVDGHGESIGQNGVVPLEFLPAVIVANTPQMILSFTYFAYNAFITRSVSEMEWNSYALSYKGLRVTDPRGEQVSTYRLQLPYSYSIPLVIASILLHWFMSNIMFAVIVEGGYIQGGTVVPGMSDSAYIGVSYSRTLILVLLFVGAIPLLITPVVFAFPKLRGRMVLCGNNSVVISAACHVTVVKHVRTSSGIAPELPQLDLIGSIEMQPLISEANQGSEPEEIGTAPSVDPELRSDNVNADQSSIDDLYNEESLELVQLSTEKVRWGVVEMPAGWNAQFEDFGVPVRHLTFGVAKQEVKEPEFEHYYA